MANQVAPIDTAAKELIDCGRRRLLAGGVAAAVVGLGSSCLATAVAARAEAHALTVNGPVRASELGVTLPHEHLLLDFSVRYAPIPGEDEVRTPLAIEDRWRLIRHPAAHKMNLVGVDIENSIREAGYFKAAGGRTVVDLTPIPLSPGPAGLRTISARTGLNVIASTGYYIDASLPAWVRSASVQALADHLVEDLTTGGAEKIRRGAIGEIAVETASELELRCVRAAGRAQHRTGAPCFFHVMSGILPSFREANEHTLDAYLEEGGDPKRLVLCHQDGSGDDPKYQMGLLNRGFYLEYDTFGSEGVFAFGPKYLQLPTDTQRIRELKVLIDAGFADQLLISQDVCYQSAKRTWGGWGMAHILDTLWPRFLAEGIAEPVLRGIMRDNPARLLGFVSA